ncbi:MAG: rod shape-determining protein MreD [Lachnospiraceae bacterium]|nr:rod shape-determining protein MreD [Lachnospiraceae bacterium]MBQ7781287.1 rod shape-determining protein MreD [Lachnospiraceae bacterium]
MRRKITVIFLIWFCFLLQSTVFQWIAFNDIVPNLLIVLTAAFGFMRGEKEGLVIGFFCGLICDIFFGDMIGFHALVMMYIGYLNGKFSGGFYPEDIKLPLALIIVSDLSYSTACYICLFLLRGRLDFPYYFMNVILPEAVYTTIVTLLLYPLILFINVRLENREKRGAQKFG